MVRVLLGSGLQEEVDCSANCAHFAQLLANQISCSHSDLNAKLAATGTDGARVPTCPLLWDTFQFIQCEDVDLILGTLRPTTCFMTSFFLVASVCLGGGAGFKK